MIKRPSLDIDHGEFARRIEDGHHVRLDDRNAGRDWQLGLIDCLLRPDIGYREQNHSTSVTGVEAELRDVAASREQPLELGELRVCQASRRR